MFRSWWNSVVRALLGITAVIAFYCAVMPVSRYGALVYDVSRFGFAAIVFGRLVFVVRNGWRRSKRLLRERSAAKRNVSSVPRRFGLGTLFVIVLAFALMSAIARWLELGPLAAIFVLAFVVSIGAFQALLDQVPRQASMAAGALYFPPVFMVLVTINKPAYVSSTPLADLAFHAACWSLGGAVVGYGTGTLVAGVFLIRSWCARSCRGDNTSLPPR